MSSEIDLSSALEDFRHARDQATIKELVGRLSGEQTQLLSFEDVRTKLKIQGSSGKGLMDIPLDAIVGSVGRYNDFTRDFLPRQSTNPERWARVKVAMMENIGLPPIDVYKIGDVYFVKDGNHRVSVAREMEATHIQAYVTEIRTRVTIDTDDSPDDLILKAEYAEFLEDTHLDDLRPEAALQVTAPGKYKDLIEHIRVHRYFMGLDLKKNISADEAVTHWYDTVYLPVAGLIDELGILRAFPKRTPADLYLWLAEYRAALEKELGQKIRPEAAALDLLHTQRRGVGISNVFKAATADKLDAGPPPGEWRKALQASQHSDKLFRDILVAINGTEAGWCAMDQALLIAEREAGRIHGIHVLPPKGAPAETRSQLQAEFASRCAAKGLRGELNFVSGNIVDNLTRWARWCDLVVTKLTYPPASQALARLSSGFSDLVRRCPRPLLAVPECNSQFKRILLAYDGSAKSDEALFMSMYLARQWALPLIVVSVTYKNKVGANTLDKARRYLDDHQVNASYLLATGLPAPHIMQTALENNCDIISMGGYGHKPIFEVLLGSGVDEVLRRSHVPVLICR